MRLRELTTNVVSPPGVGCRPYSMIFWFQVFQGEEDGNVTGITRHVIRRLGEYWISLTHVLWMIHSWTAIVFTSAMRCRRHEFHTSVWFIVWYISHREETRIHENVVNKTSRSQPKLKTFKVRSSKLLGFESEIFLVRFVYGFLSELKVY